jgi:hypothetical protein
VTPAAIRVSTRISATVFCTIFVSSSVLLAFAG